MAHDRRISDLKTQGGMVYRTVSAVPGGPPELLIYKRPNDPGWGIAHATLRIEYCLPKRMLTHQDARDLARVIIDTPELRRWEAIADWWQARRESRG